ncbi:MAG: regulatory protein GemA [Sulfitobacter sp.]
MSSATELDRDGFNAIMGFFEYLGFAPLVATGADYGNRPGMASFAQLELVRALWHEYTGGKAGEDELNKWLLGTWKTSSLRFLRKDAAQKVLTALKAMKARAA